MKAEQFVEATKPLNWLLVNVPNLNESIYIQGVTVYKGAADKTADAAQKRVYQDSVMAIYNKRGEIYNNPSKWIETKGYYGYLFYKADNSKIPAVIADFEKAVELKGSLNFQFVPMYFDLVERNYTSNKAYSPEQVLTIFDKSNKLLDAAAAAGKDVTDSKSTLETLLVKMKLIDCDFIENTLGPKLVADPTNEELAEQIFTYSLQYKCISTKAFLAALEFKDSKNPTFKTSQVRGMIYMSANDFEKAEPVFEKAMTLASTNKEKGETMMELAKIYARAGKKSAARTAAREAAGLDSELSSSAYGLIGDLYMSAYNDCRGGESRAKDYSVFIAAYNAYQKAGDSRGMGSAKARFPSKEELFTEGFQLGSSVSTGCWVGETVSLSTRD
jgi:tetratricopeptide (TPR) repeat protein